jgi:hypothetical protein
MIVLLFAPRPGHAQSVPRHYLSASSTNATGIADNYTGAAAAGVAVNLRLSGYL